MGKLDKLIGTKADRQALKDARDRLHELDDTSEESDEYLRRNRAVIDAEKNVPWLGR